MSLQFNITTTERCGIIHLNGRIISDEKLTELLQEVERFQSRGIVYWVCNCEELTYCNSTGLNFFIRLLTKSRNVGGDTGLVKLQPAVRKLFELSKLNEIFTSYATVTDAVANYNSIA